MATTRNLWPLGIILTLAAFITGTVGLVVMACSQRVDLVSPDYYERELKYQGQISETHVGGVAGLLSPCHNTGRSFLHRCSKRGTFRNSVSNCLFL